MNRKEMFEKIDHLSEMLCRLLTSIEEDGGMNLVPDEISTWYEHEKKIDYEAIRIYEKKQTSSLWEDLNRSERRVLREFILNQK